MNDKVFKSEQKGGLDFTTNFTCSPLLGHTPDFSAMSKSCYITMQNTRDVEARILSGLRY